jgi:hypothetical protein
MRHYDEQGRLRAEEWHDADGGYRDASEGPGYVTYDPVSGTVREDFYVNGEHRPAHLGPASVVRRRDGVILSEEFWDSERKQMMLPGRMAEDSVHG